MFDLWVPRPLDCLWIQEENQVIHYIDAMTDCMDLFELMSSKKGLSNDTSQRVVVLSLREFRALGILRALVHVPTVAMLADGLTKVGNFPQLDKFCTSGLVTFPIKDDKTFRVSLSSPYLPYLDSEH